MALRPYFVLLVLLAGCVSSTPVSPAPLPSDAQAELRCNLVGTWRLTAIDGDPQLMSQQTWTFRDDGTGLYEQRAMVSGSQAFEWTLEGRNIRLTGAREITYRADDFGPEAMTWFNYTLSDVFTLERTAGDGC